MDFISLDDSYRPNKLIENWQSLIWTERFRDAGDFSLETYDISATRAALPLGSCVSLMDSREVCIVETHEITKGAKGDDILKLSGRSFETFFENRITITAAKSIKDGTSGDTNATEIDGQTAAYAATNILYSSRTATIDDNNVIPNYNETFTTDSVADSDTADRQIARADTYSELVKLLEEDNCGIRNVRPAAANSGILTQNVYKYWSGVNFLPNMALDVTSGHFSGDVRYTWTIKDMKTAAYVASQFGFVKVFAKGASANTGLDHRVALIDATDITKKTSNINGMLKARGKAYLNQHKKVFTFDGKIAPDIPYKYNSDYGLGDRFKIRGDYGAEDTVQVTEFIRSQDANGEVAYPTYIT